MNASLTQVFHYEGINKEGQKILGRCIAKDRHAAIALLYQQGVLVRKITKNKSRRLNYNKKITTKHLATFSRLLATMIRSGIPISQSFEMILNAQHNKKMQQLVQLMKQDIDTGQTLFDTFHKHPKYFNSLYCHLIAAGEHSGMLDTMLDKIATYKEQIELIKSKIKKAIAYPIAIISVATIITTCMLIFVVPQFESLFQSFGVALPLMTQTVIMISRWLGTYGPLLLTSLLSIAFLIIRAQQRSSYCMRLMDKLLLGAPYIGDIVKNAAIARFSRTLAITFSAGLPLIDALKIASKVTGSIMFNQSIEQVIEAVSSGQQLHQSIDKTYLFPNMVTQMIYIGEESGALEHMLDKIADVYEQEVNHAVDVLGTLLEPIIMVFLGLLVGGLIVALYLPIFKLGSIT